MLALRPYLPDDYCSQAGQFIMDNPGGVIIVTGFYVVMAGKPETDGPPGAIAIGEALKGLGRAVTYVSDEYTTPVLRRYANGSDVIDFPIDGIDASTSGQTDKVLSQRVAAFVIVSDLGNHEGVALGILAVNNQTMLW